MPHYEYAFTVPPSSALEEEVWVEGEELEEATIRFPPGPCMLLKVALFYGLKQVVPENEGAWIAGDDEAVTARPRWKLPESPCRLIVRAVNEDTVYEHGFALRLEVKPKEERAYARLTEEGFLEVALVG
jgi:hypothetical protein